MRRWSWVTVVLALAALVALGLASAAHAAQAKGPRVLVAGKCSSTSSSKMKLSRENGRIEVELEVDQNRSGVRWAVTLTQNGTRFFSGSRVTRDPSGSFELRVRAPDRAGKDTFSARATRSSGEVCTVRASL